MGNAFTYANDQHVGENPRGFDFFLALKQKYVQFFLEHIRELGLRVQIEHISLDDLSPDKITWRQFSKIINELKDIKEHDAENEKRDNWHPATVGFVMRPGLEMPFEELPPDDNSGKGSYIPDNFTDDDASDTEEESGAEEENQDPDNAPKQPEEKGKKKVKKGKGDSEAKQEEDIDNIEPVSTIIPNDNREITQEGNSDDEQVDELEEEGSKKRSARHNSWVTPNKEKGAGSPETKTSDTTENRDSSKKSSKRKKWDPSLRSPIFYGYYETTTMDILDEKNAERNKNAAAEQRAIERAKGARSEVLEAADKVAQKQEANRLSKIEEIERR